MWSQRNFPQQSMSFFVKRRKRWKRIVHRIIVVCTNDDKMIGNRKDKKHNKSINSIDGWLQYETEDDIEADRMGIAMTKLSKSDQTILENSRDIVIVFVHQQNRQNNELKCESTRTSTTQCDTAIFHILDGVHSFLFSIRLK